MQQTTHTDLHSIRRALEANTRLTSLSGSALLASGVLAFLAAGMTSHWGLAEAAARRTLAGAALESVSALWGGTLLAAVALNLSGMRRRALRDGQALAARLGRRVLFAMLPSLFVGGALTLGLVTHQRLDLIFAVWMLCYGSALVAAGAHSVTSVRLLGVWALLAGALALLPAFEGADFALFLGTFGAGHFLLGIWVGVRHGW